MLFNDIDLYDESQVKNYFEENYPKATKSLQSFRLTKARDMMRIINSLAPGEQLTFHCFPGAQLSGNAYIFPRFLRVEGGTNGVLKVTREKSIRERYPVTMRCEDVVNYYFELADITFLQAELETCWAESWPIHQSRR